MVPSKAILVCLVFALCFVVISSEVTPRELADKTHDKTNSVEHTTPTKEVKTEANGVKPDYYGGYGGYGGYGRGYGYGGYGRGYGGYGGYGRGYGGYGGYGRGYGGYGGYGHGYGGYGGYGRGGGYYPPERKTQESTSTESPDYYPGGGYYHPYPYRPYPYRPYHPYYPPYRGGYGGHYPPGGEN